MVQYIPRNMHTVFALLCFVVVIHWLIFPYPSVLLHWHCGDLTIAPVPAKQPWWIWINTSCEFIMDDCITTTKQSTTKPCTYLLGYTVGCLYGYWDWNRLCWFSLKRNTDFDWWVFSNTGPVCLRANGHKLSHLTICFNPSRTSCFIINVRGIMGPYVIVCLILYDLLRIGRSSRHTLSNYTHRTLAGLTANAVHWWLAICGWLIMVQWRHKAKYI